MAQLWHAGRERVSSMNFSRQGIAGCHFALHAGPFSYWITLRQSFDATIVTFYRLPLGFSFRMRAFCIVSITIIFIWSRLKLGLQLRHINDFSVAIHSLLMQRLTPFYFEPYVCLKIQRYLELKVGSYLTLDISMGLFMALFSPSLRLGFSTWNIHTRGTNCEDVIPGIAFEPCSRWETVKRRKMHTLGAVLLSFPRASLFDPLCRIVPLAFNYASRESLPGGSTEFPDLGPREKFNVCLSCVARVYELLSRTRVRNKVARRGKTRDDTAT